MRQAPPLAYSGTLFPPNDMISMERDLNREAEHDLDSVAWRLRAKGIRARYTVLRGPPGRSISAYVQDHAGSMVAISTHGRSGIRRLVIGSVADKLIKSLDSPVLVVRPGQPQMEREESSFTQEAVL